MQTRTAHHLPCPAGYAIRKLKAFLDVGTIGEVFRINGERLNHGGQGALRNGMYRDVAVLLYLVGESPRIVSAHGVGSQRAGGYEDVHLELGFSRCRSAHLHTCCHWPETREGIQVFGSNGMIVYDEADQTLVVHRRFLAGKLAADPLAPMDFGSYLLLDGEGGLPDLADPGEEEDGFEGALAQDVLRILHSTELQLKGSKFI